MKKKRRNGGEWNLAHKYFTFHFPEKVKFNFKVAKINFSGVGENN